MNTRQCQIIDNTVDLLLGGWCRGTFTNSSDGLICYDLDGALDAAFCGANKNNRMSYKQYAPIFTRLSGKNNPLLIEIKRLVVVASGYATTTFNDKVAVDVGDVIHILGEVKNFTHHNADSLPWGSYHYWSPEACRWLVMKVLD